jgi:hypothetical protein
MKNVIRIPETEKKLEEKPIQFTHRKGTTGWRPIQIKTSYFDKIVYLGVCKFDGDMFAGYRDGIISIYKGYINSGKF